MYGSNYSYQVLTTKRFSTAELEASITRPKLEKKKSFFMAGLIAAMMIVSAASFAGSSQPKIAGNNGNASGR
jgi:hypothetical protein